MVSAMHVLAYVLVALYGLVWEPYDHRAITWTAPPEVAADMPAALGEWGLEDGGAGSDIVVVYGGEANIYGAADAQKIDGVCTVRLAHVYEPSPLRPEGKDYWYNVLLHEIGHCLGFGHPLGGEGRGFSPGWFPSALAQDVTPTALDKLLVSLLY